MLILNRFSQRVTLRHGARSVISSIDKYKLASDVDTTFAALTDSENARLATLSKKLLSDPICEVSVAQSQAFLLPTVPFTDSFLDRIKWAYSGRSEGTNRLFKLTMERLENRKLQEALGVGSSFNQQMFWMMLHAWVFHKRMIAFDDGAQEEDYFEALFRVIDQWLLVKEIPRHRLTMEIANAQRHALGFCVALDVAIEKPDMLGGRVHETLWRSFHEGGIPKEDKRLIGLTKYTIRQASYALNIPKDNFLQGKFIWIDFPVGRV